MGYGCNYYYQKNKNNTNKKNDSQNKTPKNIKMHLQANLSDNFISDSNENNQNKIKMEIYECILSLISGIGVFILAMKLLSESLKEFAGEKMKLLLKKITGNKIKGVLIGV
jgi:hypothetical protein